jgi:hypothetical protein
MTWCGVPGASSRACRGILALALRLESWGTPSELFLSVNNVPHYIELHLDGVIYSEGFNRETFMKTLDILRECVKKVRALVGVG